MKTIQQLLDLSKNPFYRFTDAEQAVLDDFLSQKQESDSKKSQKESSKKSSKSTPVTVRNIVQKVDTYPHEDHESSRDGSQVRRQ